MHKSFLITEEERSRILGMHNNATSKQYLKENEEDWIDQSEDMDFESDYSKAELEKEVLDQAEMTTDNLSSREKEILSNFINSVNPEDFLELVQDEINNLSMGPITEDEKEDLGMSNDEYQVRKIIDKVIRGTSAVAGLAVLPAAMFVGGGVAIALGVTALATMLLKDVAWWSPKGHDKYKSSVFHKTANKARREGGNY